LNIGGKVHKTYQFELTSIKTKEAYKNHSDIPTLTMNQLPTSSKLPNSFAKIPKWQSPKQDENLNSSHCTKRSFITRACNPRNDRVRKGKGKNILDTNDDEHHFC
jgi:hypothetical protein